MNLSRPRNGAGIVNTDREAYEKAKMRAEHLKKQKRNEALLENLEVRVKALEAQMREFKELMEITGV